MAGTGATVACAGTGAECTAAAPTGSRSQGRWQGINDDGDRSLPDLGESSDDGRDGDEVGLDELVGSSEPVQSLPGASSADGVLGIDGVYDVCQGVKSVPAEQTYAECSASADAKRLWADVDALLTAPPTDWQPKMSSGEWTEYLFGMLPVPLRRWIDVFEPIEHAWLAAGSEGPGECAGGAELKIMLCGSSRLSGGKQHGICSG